MRIIYLNEDYIFKMRIMHLKWGLYIKMRNIQKIQQFCIFYNHNVFRNNNFEEKIVKIYKYILSDQGPPDMPKYVYD